MTNYKSIASNKKDAQNTLIVDAIQDIKGKNIVLLDLRGLEERPTDFFIICEGDSSTQVNAISQNVKKKIKGDIGVRPLSMEGISGSNWVLIDYFDTIVHVFHPSTREFYDLEDLWSDGDITEYQNI